MSGLDPKEFSRIDSITADSEKKNVSISHHDYGAVDLTQALLFGADISLALEFHAPSAAWWATMVSEERKRLHLFQEGVYLRYMAHCRYYAKLALKGMGDKETLEAVRDYVSILFSKDRSNLAQSLIRAAWWGDLLTTHGTATAAKKHTESQATEALDRMKDSFEASVYSWERDRNVTYDDIIALEADIKKNVEVLDAVLEAFQQRGILLSSLAADRRAEKNVMGTSHINNLVRGVASQVPR